MYGAFFLGVNLKYLQNKKVILRAFTVQDMTGRHTEALKSGIMDILNIYDIPIHQLYSITTDKASNMQK